jgi:hypothetical protein
MLVSVKSARRKTGGAASWEGGRGLTVANPRAIAAIIIANAVGKIMFFMSIGLPIGVEKLPPFLINIDYLLSFYNSNYIALQ